jgi:hypothetical protein
MRKFFIFLVEYREILRRSFSETFIVFKFMIVIGKLLTYIYDFLFRQYPSQIRTTMPEHLAGSS